MKYGYFNMSILFLVICIFSSLIVFGADEMDMHDEATMGGADIEMSSSMIPYHILEITLAIGVAVLVFRVIKATGQMSIFIYIPIAMLVFVTGSIVDYLPHVIGVNHNTTIIIVLVLNSIALALMGLSFYKWKKMLG